MANRSRPAPALSGRPKRIGLPVVAAVLAFGPTAAWADIPMFVVVSALKLSAFPYLVIVVLLEAAALSWVFALRWNAALLTSLYANAFSMAVGFLAYPVFGGIFYVALSPFVIQNFGGTVSVEIIATFAVVSVLDTVIELPFVAWLRRVRITLWSSLVFLIANVVGMAVLAAALVDQDEMFQPPIPDETIARIERVYAPEIAFMRQIFGELDEVYAGRSSLHGSEWVDRVRAEAVAEDYRFRQLTVSRQTAYPIVRDPDRLHSTSGRRDTGAGEYLRDDVRVWRTLSQGGVWFYVYEIRTSRNNADPMVRAWFEPP